MRPFSLAAAPTRVAIATIAALHIACAPAVAPVTPALASASATIPPRDTSGTHSEVGARLDTQDQASATIPPRDTSGTHSEVGARLDTQDQAPAPSPPPPALQQALDAARTAIATGDFAAADRSIEAATAAAGADAHLAFLVAHLRATRFVYAADFDRAAASFVAVIPALAGHPELPDEFWAHNAMMMIREAQGDPAAALAENDQATLAASRGTWDPNGRDTLAFQKDRWHRAYLTRMLAESRAGSAKDALVQYARAALDEYRARGGFAESVAVLDAYFAALDHKAAEALAAARRVDPSKDDDEEDLYLVVVGLEAGGDHAGAEAVRRAMRRPGAAHIPHAIMLRWLDLDAKAPRAHGFTPWRATLPP
jgi:hypothetical protein